MPRRLSSDTHVVITADGLTFAVRLKFDDMLGPPWKEHDGHGPVSSWRSGRDKRPGERVLWEDRGQYIFYDMRAAVEIAKRDGWGLPDDALGRLTKALGRAPTPGEIAAAAVEADYTYLRRWCAEDWYWCAVTVTLLDTDGGDTPYSRAVSGIESDTNAYLLDTARDLAAEIAAEVGDAHEIVETHTWAVRVRA